jgi:hypothetical protein
MPTTTTQHAPPADEPKHPLHALTTYELRDYRRQLENAIAFSSQQIPYLRYAPIRADIQRGTHRAGSPRPRQRAWPPARCLRADGR